jgi:hypothetical protein
MKLCDANFERTGDSICFAERYILILKVCKREITEVSEQESTGVSMPGLFNLSV